MIIHAYILAWNESKILPFTLDYYSKFCDKIIIFDNMSTDNSDEIYKKYSKVQVIKWNSNNEIDERNYLTIKNNVYKNSRGKADWVIVCDCDEFLYHSNLINKLEEYKRNNIDVPLICGHDMISDKFPEYDGKFITDKIKIGSERYIFLCKKIIFNPIIDLQFGIGSHTISGNFKVSESEELKLLHYKLLGFDYVIERYKQLNDRLSEMNIKNKWGIHYKNPPIEYMKELLNKKYKVI